jgi:hypothetical protein
VTIIGRALFIVVLSGSWLGLARAETFYQIDGAFRTFPRSASGDAQLFYNEKLWSQENSEQPWKYGFWRAGAYAAVHGQAGVKVEVYPISIWQLSLQESLTSRFYETQTLDCAAIECRGILQRGTFKTSLVLGYGNLFMVPSYVVTDLSLDSDKKNFASEEDNIVADRAGDQLVTTQLALGYKSGEDRWVIVHKISKMRQTNDRNESQYVVWNKVVNPEWNFFVGGGFFDSSYVEKSFSAVAGASWKVGEDLSLF